MNAERLWAPWRLSYIAGDAATEAPPEPKQWLAGADASCFLCRAAGEFADAATARRQLLVVERGPLMVGVLNRYPYNNGHLLVSPLRHVGELGDLTRDEHVAAMGMLTHYMELYRRIIRAEGFNVGLNIGRVAGAGVPGHLHWHLVPRWTGDSNSMPVTADVRVISQSLDELWIAIAAETQR